MKQETLKKIVELAEGFRWWNEESKMTSTDIYKTTKITNFFIGLNSLGRYIMVIEPDDITIWYLYPLLLRRAVEGWNERYPVDTVEMDNQSVYCPESGIGHFITESTEYLTPQEQAIEACLIELLE